MKTFDDLPGPSLLTNLCWFFIRGYLLHTHELQIKYRRYGPMFRSVIGRYKLVNIMDPEIMELVLRQEGKYPMRNDMDIWKDHRNQRNLSYGPFTEEGHRWHTLRTTLNKRLLKPSEAKIYAGSINEVVSDLMERIQDLRRDSPSGNTVNDIANVFYRFAFEGVSYILFETRIGCMSEQIPPETQKFIDSIAFMLKNSVYVTYLPPWTRKVLPYWKRYIKGWDDILDYGKKLVDKKMSEIQQRLERGEEVRGEYLTYLLSSGKLSVAEVYGSVCELLLAGVDTTQFVLNHYAISRDENNFEQAEKFLPQRWLRGGRMKHHPFSSIPFGYGIRACVGRRIAELEMYLALARIINMFEVHYNSQEKKIKPMVRILLVPSKPINLEFVER
ncbi:sterol 26-hydroxylase, mitochondrial isoform X2 [Phyllobates terribilis]|uniref:sterol 26-hydroxylase, mitochondrial isoform X2 n=1 Tax=Phyllobates terribilis TaxID=111132 RepID=UPI003CCB42FA